MPGRYSHCRQERSSQVIARTGPQLLTDALVAMGLELKKGLFDAQYERNGVGEYGFDC